MKYAHTLAVGAAALMAANVAGDDARVIEWGGKEFESYSDYEQRPRLPPPPSEPKTQAEKPPPFRNGGDATDDDGAQQPVDVYIQIVLPEEPTSLDVFPLFFPRGGRHHMRRPHSGIVRADAAGPAAHAHARIFPARGAWHG